MPGSEPAATRFPSCPTTRTRSERRRRPWFLVAAALLLVILVAVVWGKWSESRTEAQALRAELKQVYFEAEAIRTQADQAQQRAALAEQHGPRAADPLARAERSDLLKRMEAPA